MAMVLFAERVFQVWSYTVGMGRLLLRSPKSPGAVTRVDVLFQNVKALKRPASSAETNLGSPRTVTSDSQLVVAALSLSVDVGVERP